MSGKCQINRSVKVQPIKDFLKTVGEEFTQYIGIAIDEPVRMKRVANAGNQVSLLEKYEYTEQMAFGLCKKIRLTVSDLRICSTRRLLVLPECTVCRIKAFANKSPGFME